MSKSAKTPKKGKSASLSGLGGLPVLKQVSNTLILMSHTIYLTISLAQAPKKDVATDSKNTQPSISEVTWTYVLCRVCPVLWRCPLITFFFVCCSLPKFLKQRINMKHKEKRGKLQRRKKQSLSFVRLFPHAAGEQRNT